MSPYEDDGLRLFREFQEEVKQCTRTSVFQGRHDFLLVNRLRSWMQEPIESHSQTQSSRAGVLLEKFYPSNREPYHGAFRDYGQHLVPGDKQSWIDILIILLQIDAKTLSLLERFHDDQIFDSYIPVILRHPGTLEGIVRADKYARSHDVNDFVKRFMIFAHQITASQNINLPHAQEMLPGTILPFTLQQSIGSGGQSQIYRIEVPSEAMPEDITRKFEYGPTLDTLHTSMQNSGEKDLIYELALKRMKHEDDWKREVEFHRAAVNTKGIVQCFGSWKISVGKGHEYYLLLELGWADLEHFFRTYEAPPLITDALTLWTNFRDIAMTLKCIHTFEISSAATKETYFGWHGDIKLSNFLICPSSDGDTIKLTDFGFAKLQVSIPGADENKATTVLHGGTEDYGGPERIDSTTGKIDRQKPVTRSFDVWSLGCAIYEAATWIILGSAGIERFRILRKIKDGEAHDLDYGDIEGNEEFHLDAKVSSVVDMWHNHLLIALRGQDCITGEVLEIAKTHMLRTDPNDRASAAELVGYFDDALYRAKSKAAVISEPELLLTAWRLHHQQSQQESGSKASTSATHRSTRAYSTRFTKPTNIPSSPEQSMVAEFSGNYRYSPNRPLSATGRLYSPLNDGAGPPARPFKHLQTMPEEPRTMPLTVLERASEEAVDTNQVPSFGYWDAVRLLNDMGWTHSTAIDIPGSMGRKQDFEPQKLRRSWRSFGSKTSLSEDRGQASPRNSALWHYIRFGKATPGSRDAVRSTTEPNEQQKSQEKMFGDMFNDRDIILLFDNRQGMHVHWPQVQAVAAVLMAMLHGQDQDGVDAYFSSHQSKYSKRSDPSKLQEDLEKERPSREGRDHASIHTTLDHVLDVISKGKSYKHKVTLIIFTNGDWVKQERELIELAIEKWLRHSEIKGTNASDPRRYTLQFIHFGNEPDSFEALESMDDDLCKKIGVTDVIDVERADDNIHKMIMGSLDDTWDRSKTITTTRTENAPPLARYATQIPTSPVERAQAPPMHHLPNRTQTMQSAATHSGGLPRTNSLAPGNMDRAATFAVPSTSRNLFARPTSVRQDLRRTNTNQR